MNESLHLDRGAGRAIALGCRDDQTVVIDNDQGEAGASAVQPGGKARDHHAYPPARPVPLIDGSQPQRPSATMEAKMTISDHCVFFVRRFVLFFASLSGSLLWRDLAVLNRTKTAGLSQTHHINRY